MAPDGWPRCPGSEEATASALPEDWSGPGRGLEKSQEVANSKKEKEWFEWVPWKQILDWYGEEEALARVESGLIAVKKVGKKFYEFLLVKIRTELTLEQKKGLLLSKK